MYFFKKSIIKNYIEDNKRNRKRMNKIKVIVDIGGVEGGGIGVKMSRMNDHIEIECEKDEKIEELKKKISKKIGKSVMEFILQSNDYLKLQNNKKLNELKINENNKKLKVKMKDVEDEEDFMEQFNDFNLSSFIANDFLLFISHSVGIKNVNESQNNTMAMIGSTVASNSATTSTSTNTTNPTAQVMHNMSGGGSEEKKEKRKGRIGKNPIIELMNEKEYSNELIKLLKNEFNNAVLEKSEEEKMKIEIIKNRTWEILNQIKLNEKVNSKIKNKNKLENFIKKQNKKPKQKQAEEEEEEEGGLIGGEGEIYLSSYLLKIIHSQIYSFPDQDWENEFITKCSIELLFHNIYSKKQFNQLKINNASICYFIYLFSIINYFLITDSNLFMSNLFKIENENSLITIINNVMEKMISHSDEFHSRIKLKYQKLFISNLFNLFINLINKSKEIKEKLFTSQINKEGPPGGEERIANALNEWMIHYLLFSKNKMIRKQMYLSILDLIEKSREEDKDEWIINYFFNLLFENIQGNRKYVFSKFHYNLFDFYFLLFSDLIKQLKYFGGDKEKNEKIMNDLMELLKENENQFKEKNEYNENDINQILIGLFNVIKLLIIQYPSLKNDKKEFIIELYEKYLFQLSLSTNTNMIEYHAICKNKQTRFHCFQLMIEFARGNAKNFKHLTMKLFKEFNELNLDKKKNKNKKRIGGGGGGGMGSKSNTGNGNGNTVGSMMNDFDIISTTNGNKMKLTQYCGLSNLGATCYMNSLLQQLFFIIDFRKQILQIQSPNPSISRESSRTFSDEQVVGCHGKIKEVGEREGEEEKKGEIEEGLKVVGEIEEMQKVNRSSSVNMNDEGNEGDINKEEEYKGEKGEEEEEEESRIQSQEGGYDILEEVQLVFGSLQDSLERYISTMNLCQTITDSDGILMNPRRQMDANEFFNNFLDQLEVKLNKLNIPTKEVIKKIFSGKYVYQIKCNNCLNVSESYEHFNTIGIETKNKKDMKSSFDSFINGEEVPYTCEACSVRINANRRCFINNLPPVLLIQLKRFEFDLQTMRNTKLNDEFSFPIELNMEGYTKEGVLRRERQINNENQKENIDNQGNGNGNGNGSNYMNDNNNNNNKEDDLKKREKEYYEYELVGVVVHSGTAQGGHYYSFIKERGFVEENQTARWFKFDDFHVSEWNIANVAKECYGGKETYEEKNKVTGKMEKKTVEKMANAYILIYQRKTKTIEENKNKIPIKVEIKQENIKSQILEANKKILKEKLIYDEFFFQFIWNLVDLYTNEYYLSKKYTLSTTSHTEEHTHHGEKDITDIELLMLSVELGTRFFIDIYSIYQSNTHLPIFAKHLLFLYSNYPIVRISLFPPFSSISFSLPPSPLLLPPFPSPLSFFVAPSLLIQSFSFSFPS